MQKAKVVDGANPDGTANDETIYQPGTWNDNTFNIFKLVEAAGYTLIDDDLSQLTKAVKGPYVSTFTYNTSSIPSQTVSDVVRGSDGKYYQVQNNAVTGDDPVGSVTGNWLAVSFDNGLTVAGASETAKGIVELATNAEVIAGIDTTRVVTPAGLQAKGASETAKGIVELATNAEVQTGTDTVRAVTPAGMKAGLNASGTAPIYACRAWVNFNGTGTVAIRASGNVSSITDNGVGDYTVNFTTAMVDANYSFTGTHNGNTQSLNPNPSIFTTSSIRFTTTAGAGSGMGVSFVNYDPVAVSVAIFR